MTYTTAEAAARAGLTAHTLRYYDKEGLLPFVERDAVGNRAFKESDFNWLQIIKCLKETGMPIKKIKQYIQWGMEGESTYDIRLEVMKNHKKIVEKQLEEIQGHLKKVNYKIEFYEKAIEERDADLEGKAAASE